MIEHEANSYDVAVVGLGAVGAAALYRLAKAGARVLGIDQFSPPHIYGSSHGDTRITRQAIGEGESYVPLVLRSHEIWRDLERTTGSRLLVRCGGLILGDLAGAGVHHSKPGFLASTMNAAKKFGIEHEILETKQLRKRFPQFAISDSEVGYFEPGAGYVRPEEAVRVQLALAKDLGADLRLNQQVLELQPQGVEGSVLVRTAAGDFRAGQAIVSAGPWVNGFLKLERPYFRVFRQVLYWFAPRGSITPFEPSNFPIFIWSFEHPHGDGMYGFPAVDGPGGGVKVAGEQYEIETTPDTLDRHVSAEETTLMYEHYIKARFPLLSSRCVKSVSCMYTTTPDSDFVIQRHPQSQQIIVASPCSGHGFKHSPAVGEALAQLAVSGSSSLDISAFRMK